VLNAEHGARIGQALFAESFSDKIKAEEGLQIVAPFETVALFGKNKQKIEVGALINTGRYRSTIAGELAKSLGLLDRRDLLWFQHEKSEGKAPVVEVTFKMKQHKKTSAFVVSKSLNKSKIQLEIGRMDLGGFLVGENS
jgi:hypothetical protein